MDIGELRVDPVVDGAGRFVPTKSYRGTTVDQWRGHEDLLDADGRLSFAIGGFLIRGLGHTTLVDLGGGPTMFRGMRGGAFLGELAALGVSPEQVTDVIFSHLHVDHVGWARTGKGTPTFPNAVYRCARADWTFFMTEEHTDPALAMTAPVLTPISDRFELWDGQRTLLPGVDVLPAPGHTPGSVVVVVSSGSARAVLLGDVVHCPVELVDDEWAGLGDVDAGLARRTRAALSRELEGGETAVSAAHFPGLRFGRLLRAEGRRRWLVGQA